MQAWGATSSIPHTHDLDLTEQRHQVSCVASLWRAWMTIRVEDRGRHSARATLIQVGLQQAAQQFAAFNLQQRFEFAVGHLVYLRRVQLRDEIIEMLVGSGVDVGDWQGMSDSTGWHHQSSFVVRQGYDAPSLPQTPCSCTVIWPAACFPATVPKEPHPGEQAGAVAIGRVQELPVARHSVRYPEALGDDLWVSTPSPPPEVVLGMAIEEFRGTPEEGMLTRSALKEHSLMGKHRIIRTPQGTVFRLSAEEGTVLESLWGIGTVMDASSLLPSALEGTWQLRLHHRRERSRTLIEQKKAHFKRAHE